MKKLLGLIFVIVLYFSLQVYWIWASPEVVEVSIAEFRSVESKDDSLKFILEVLRSENTEEDQCSFPDPQLSPSDDKLIFGYREFDKCDTPTKLDLQILNRTFFAKCENNQIPLFAIDTGSQQIFGGNVKQTPKWSKTPYLQEASEYAIIKCGKSSIYTYFFNRFKASNSNKANQIRNTLNPSNRQFNVLNLVFDSISKYSAYRNLPKTTSFLKDLSTNSKYNKSLSAYNFHKPTTPKPRTLNNMSIILYGKHLEEIQKTINKELGPLKEISREHLSFQKKFSIWSHYKSLGYTTMFLMDTVWDYLPTITGRFILADHVFVNFWRVAWSVYGWQDFTNGQKCLGLRNSHTVSLNYTLQYFENYKENNKFAHVHLDAAHEDFGNVKTVDEPVLDFLKKFIKLMDDRDEDFVVFFIGDHGIKRVYQAQWDLRMSFEANVPMTYLLVSKKFEKNWDLQPKLTHNSQQLLGRFDINLSLKDLAYYPYNIPKDSYYEVLKNSYKLPGVSSIFTEYLNPARNCEDLGVSGVYCPCTKFSELSYYNELNEDNIVDIIIDLLEEYFKRLSDKYEECQEMNEFEIEEKKVFRMKSRKEGLDKIFYVKGLANGAEVEVLANFCCGFKIEHTKKILNREIYPSTYYTINNKLYFTQLSYVEIQKAECEIGCLC